MRAALVCAALAAGAGEARAAADAGVALPEAIVLPETGGCVLRASKMWRTVTLELAPGVPYLEVEYADPIEATLPIGADGPRAGVRVVSKGVRVAGFATPAGLRLFPRRAFLVGELFAPSAHVPLRWVEVEVDRIAVALQLDKRSKKFIRDVKGPLRAWLLCNDLLLNDSASFDYYDSIGGRGMDAPMRLRSSSVPISARPRAPPVATLALTAKNDQDGVRVVDDDDGGWSRIAWESADGVLVVGWVKQAHVTRRRPMKPGEAYGVGGLGLVGTGSGGGGKPPPPPLVCDDAIDLVAQAGGHRLTVGSIDPGVKMRAGPADGDLISIELVDSMMSPVKGARLLVPRAQVERCRGFPAGAAP